MFQFFRINPIRRSLEAPKTRKLNIFTLSNYDNKLTYDNVWLIPIKEQQTWIKNPEKPRTIGGIRSSGKHQSMLRSFAYQCSTWSVFHANPMPICSYVDSNWVNLLKRVAQTGGWGQSFRVHLKGMSQTSKQVRSYWSSCLISYEVAALALGFLRQRSYMRLVQIRLKYWVGATLNWKECSGPTRWPSWLD